MHRAYRDADGWFFFAGRSNEWLRVDGENFAAAPVERIVLRAPGVRSTAVESGLIGAERFDEGIRDLYRTAADDGTFSYTFFKAVATNVVEVGDDLAGQLAGSGASFTDLLGRAGD